MCYSAMVRQDMDKIARHFRAKVNYESFAKLYAMRTKNLDLVIPAGMDEFFEEKDDRFSKSIRTSIKSFKELEDRRCRQELKDIESEILELESKLRVKFTKTAEKILGVRGRQKEKLLKEIKRMAKSNDKKIGDYRIYPKYFAPVVIADGKDRMIVPMRYRILPSTGVEIPMKYNLFNARRDSLQDRRTWKPLFGKKHVIFPFLKFYEWVEPKPGIKKELFFTPDGFESMWAASLYEEYKSPGGDIFSFAMVTDEPPPEVAAAGHDRCPVFLDEEHLEPWLHPAKLSIKELDGLLDHKQETYYSHTQAA